MNITIKFDRWLWAVTVGSLLAILFAKTPSLFYGGLAALMLSFATILADMYLEDLMKKGEQELDRWIALRYAVILTMIGAFVTANSLWGAPFFSVILPGGAAVCLSIWLVAKVGGIARRKRLKSEETGCARE